MTISQRKDQQIIMELQRDARQSNVAIAAKLGLSEGAVRRRIDRLESEGLISFTVITKPEYMGYAVHVMIRVQTDPDRTDDIIELASRMPELSYVYQCTGQFNITLVGYFRDIEELREFTAEHVGRIPGVVSFRTVVILRVAKRAQQFVVSDHELDGTRS